MGSKIAQSRVFDDFDRFLRASVSTLSSKMQICKILDFSANLQYLRISKRIFADFDQHFDQKSQIAHFTTF